MSLVMRYKVQQEPAGYNLKGCDDGDLVDYSAYRELEWALQEATNIMWDMAESGWCMHGVEGMDPTQQAVSDWTLAHPRTPLDRKAEHE